MFQKGLIEAFYGKTWTFEQRHEMLEFLKDIHFTHYLYAPKSDDYLRKHCQHAYPDAELKQLETFRKKAYSQGIKWGVGLSPIGLFEQEEPVLDSLDEKLSQLASLKPDTVAILFDDMRGDIPGLASKQASMVEYVARSFPWAEIIMCPTYYSEDLVLEDIFGKRPSSYWKELGLLLPPAIKIFWTGPKVVTEKYQQGDFDTINKLLNRKITLWDNSMVNDGKITSGYLPIKSMDYLEQAQINIDGYFINPMNPPALAKINLQTLALSGDSQERLLSALETLAPEVADKIIAVLPELRDAGLESINEQRKIELRQIFSGIDSPYVVDIMDWLNGAFRFDPECLT